MDIPATTCSKKLGRLARCRFKARFSTTSIWKYRLSFHVEQPKSTLTIMRNMLIAPHFYSTMSVNGCAPNLANQHGPNTEMNSTKYDAILFDRIESLRSVVSSLKIAHVALESQWWMYFCIFEYIAECFGSNIIHR